MRNPFARTEPTAAERLENVQAAILAGENVTAAELAQARAEIDAEKELEELTTRGKIERDRAAKALAKRQADAKAALRKNPPAPPEGEIPAAVAAIKTAIQELVDARTAHAGRIVAAKKTFTDADIAERHTYGGVEDEHLIDYNNCGYANLHAITVDGVTYSTADYDRALHALAQHALALSGSTHRIP